MNKKIFSFQACFQIFFSVIFCFVFSVPVQALQCQERFQEHIESFAKEDGFISDFSQHISSKEPYSSTKTETIKSLRKFYCNLEKMCKGIEFSYVYAQKEKEASDLGKTLDVRDCSNEESSAGVFCLPKFDFPICNQVYESGSDWYTYTLEDFKGEKAICPFDAQTKLSSIDETRRYCQSLMKGAQVNSFLLVEAGYQQVAQQDQGNYYSAKLLSLSARLKSLGDTFQRLKEKIQQTFHSITCRCSN